MPKFRRFMRWIVLVASITLIVYSLFWIMAAQAQAGPFLVCDPTSEEVDMYEIEVNGLVQPATFENVGTDQVRIHHDLEPFPVGAYSIRARAGNMWGWSGWSDPLAFTKAVPTGASTAGLGIEE